MKIKILKEYAAGKVGDIVVAKKNLYAGHSSWIKEHEKYFIIDIVRPYNMEDDLRDKIRVSINSDFGDVSFFLQNKDIALKNI
jgi:hypothetical protein